MRAKQHPLPPARDVEEVHPRGDNLRPEPEEEIPRSASQRVVRLADVVAGEGEESASAVERRRDDFVEHLRASFAFRHPPCTTRRSG